MWFIENSCMLICCDVEVCNWCVSCVDCILGVMWLEGSDWGGDMVRFGVVVGGGCCGRGEVGWGRVCVGGFFEEFVYYFGVVVVYVCGEEWCGCWVGGWRGEWLRCGVIGGEVDVLWGGECVCVSFSR